MPVKCHSSWSSVRELSSVWSSSALFLALRTRPPLPRPRAPLLPLEIIASSSSDCSSSSWPPVRVRVCKVNTQPHTQPHTHKHEVQNNMQVYLNMCPLKRNAQTTQKRTKRNITMKTISKRRCLERGRALPGPLLPSGRRTRKRKGLQFRVLQFDSKLTFGARTR